MLRARNRSDDSQGDNVVEIPELLRDLLTQLSLVREYRITDAGFQFLLRDRRSQAWQLLLGYLQFWEDRKARSMGSGSGTEGTGHSMKVLAFLLELSYRKYAAWLVCYASTR